MASSTAVILSNWIAFLSLTASYLGLLIFSLRYKGPTGKEAYYNGFRENNMLGVFINLFCCSPPYSLGAVAYFAKVVASHGDDDGFVAFTTIRYLDYMTTCPLLTVDLMWNLEAPYKFSAGALVLVCLTFAVATDSSPAPARFVWFGTGLSFFIFSYSFILVIVKERLSFFANCARDSNAKKSIGYLKMALFSYFGIWIFFPILWLLSPRALGMIDMDTQHVFHCILDVIAKSCYGFALLYFKVFFDKKLSRQAAGVDEEEFHKFSKDVTTHKNDEEEEYHKKKKKEVHLPSHSREGSPTPSDLEMGYPSAQRAASRASTRSNEIPRTSFSTRGSSHMKVPYKNRRSSLEDSPQFNGHIDEDGMEVGSAMPQIDFESDGEDEAAFVERARQQWELTRARSRSMRSARNGEGLRE